MSRRDVLYVSPAEPASRQAPSVAEPQEVAAGMTAVFSSLKQVMDKPGLVRGTASLLRMNQKGGSDCSSCAWPDPEHRSVAEFCENGAKALADETTKRRITAEFFQNHSVEELSRLTDYQLNRLGRLTEPMYLSADQSHYRPVSWEQAFDLLGERIEQTTDSSRLVFYTSGRASNEAAFLYGTLARLLGTNNLPDCSNMCHESTGSALSKTIGVGVGTVTLEDFERTDLILIVGQNPGTNHPRMLTALEQAKRNGSTLVSINPLFETGLNRFKNPQDFMNPIKAISTLAGSGTALADLHLPVKIGGDLALFKGICKALLEIDDAVDNDFISSQTVGFEALKDDLESADWARLEESSGLSAEQMREVARLAAGTRRIIVCWAMGITQHTNSVDTITQLVNFVLMRGAIGIPGAGLCPVRGHSNVQGDRTMGIYHKPGEAFLEALGAEFGFEPPSEAGFDVVEAIEAMREGEVDLFFSLGGNLLSAAPDTKATAEGLSKCGMTVSVATKLNRAHLVTGSQALILPCLGRTERDSQASGDQYVTVENSMGRVHSSRGTLDPASPLLRSEVSIICGLAWRLGHDWSLLECSYSAIRESIARVIPGFEQYNRRIEEEGGFYRPNGPKEGRFTTPDEKAHFTVCPISEDSSQEFLDLMTIRSHDQFNTVVYGNDDRYRGVYGTRRVVFANEADLARLGIKPGAWIDVESEHEGVRRRVEGFQAVSYPIPEGCCAAYFPEANPLVPLTLRDPESGCPASKRVPVRLIPAE